MCIKISNIKLYRFTPHFPFQKACEFYSIARIDLYLNSQHNIVWVINFCSNLYIAFRGYRHFNPNWFVSMVPAKSLSCAPRFFESLHRDLHNNITILLQYCFCMLKWSLIYECEKLLMKKCCFLLLLNHIIYIKKCIVGWGNLF